jgi:polyisoprenoid-binding protein YceI
MKSNLLTNALVALVAPACLSSAWAAPVAYELNKDHTDVTFTINHAGLSMKHGSFGDVSGKLQLDTERLSASTVEVTVAVNSIYTSHVKRDQDLQSEQFFDAAHFPTMHFVSTKVAAISAAELDVTGDLTLHGVTLPLVLHARINNIGKSPFGGVQTAGFTAVGTLKRSDFGIKTMIPLIGDDVSLTIDTEFAVPQQK